MRNSHFNLYSKLMYIPATVVALISLTMVACGEVTMDDYSSEPAYISIIGKKFRVKEDVWALGITSDKNYKNKRDYIVLVPGVGFSGPEVVSRDRLSKGSIVKVVRVFKAKSLFSSKVVYVVEEVSSNKFDGVEIRVTLVGSGDDSNFGLDSSIYKIIGQ